MMRLLNKPGEKESVWKHIEERRGGRGPVFLLHGGVCFMLPRADGEESHL